MVRQVQVQAQLEGSWAEGAPQQIVDGALEKTMQRRVGAPRPFATPSPVLWLLVRPSDIWTLWLGGKPAWNWQEEAKARPQWAALDL